MPHTPPPTKHIAVYFTRPGFDDYPFNKPDYRDGYHLLGKLVEDRGGRLSIVRSQNSYRGNNTFVGSWEFQDGTFVRREEKKSFDLVFNKGRNSFDSSSFVLNDPALDAICTDKWKTYELFKDECPVTFVVRHTQELKEALQKIPSAIAVAKPIDGEEGNGVIIGPHEKIIANVTEFPYMVQELIDTGGGIPGIAPGRHDFRLVTVQGEIVAAFVRMPADGKYIANVAQGGSIAGVDVARIPTDAKKIFARIDAEFSRFSKRMYSLDLGLDRSGRWKIIELNAQPGLSIDDYNDGPAGKRLFERVADLLTSR